MQIFIMQLRVSVRDRLLSNCSKIVFIRLKRPELKSSQLNLKILTLVQAYSHNKKLKTYSLQIEDEDTVNVALNQIFETRKLSK